jgi:hypothetical protein
MSGITNIFGQRRTELCTSDQVNGCFGMQAASARLWRASGELVRAVRGVQSRNDRRAADRLQAAPQRIGRLLDLGCAGMKCRHLRGVE